MEKELTLVFDSLSLIDKISSNTGMKNLRTDDLKKSAQNLMGVLVNLTDKLAKQVSDAAHPTIPFAKTEEEDNKDRIIPIKKMEVVEKPAPIETKAETNVNTPPEENKLGEESVSTEPVVTETQPAVTGEDISSESTTDEPVVPTTEIKEEVSTEGRYKTLGEASESLIQPCLERVMKGESFNNGKFRQYLHEVMIATFPADSLHIVTEGEDVEKGRKQRNSTIDFLQTEVLKLVKAERLRIQKQKEEDKRARKEAHKSNGGSSAVSAAAAVIADNEGKDIVAPAASTEGTIVVTPQQIADAANATAIELSADDLKMVDKATPWADVKRYLIQGMIQRNVSSMTDKGVFWALSIMEKRSPLEPWVTMQRKNATTGRMETEAYNWIEKQLPSLKKAV